MGREVDVALVALRDTLEQYFERLPRPAGQESGAWTPEFMLVADTYREMEISRPAVYLSVDDRRRLVDVSDDRMTGLTYVDVPFRAIMIIPRNTRARGGLDAVSPRLGERMARDLAVTILGSMRRRMLFYTGGDRTGIYRGVTPPTATVRDGVSFEAGREYWPALQSPMMPQYCRRLRGADVLDAGGQPAKGMDDATVIIWEIIWRGAVATDPAVFPDSELYEETFRLDRLYGSVQHQDEQDLGNPELVAGEPK